MFGLCIYIKSDNNKTEQKRESNTPKAPPSPPPHLHPPPLPNRPYKHHQNTRHHPNADSNIATNPATLAAPSNPGNESSVTEALNKIAAYTFSNTKKKLTNQYQPPHKKERIR
jgi:hypothetical protein